MNHPGEYGEAAWVHDNIQLPEQGVFLDIGCAWPTLNSNTAWLRERGWRGICIDGNPIYQKHWKGVPNVDYHCCVLGDGGKALFDTSSVPELSRIGTGTEVQTVRLMDLLKDVPQIDFLSCDAEGAEFDILKTLDWQKYRPKVVIAEFNTMNIGRDWRVAEMLCEMGYVIRFSTLANLIFVA